jgi:hypothetical protein
MKKQLLLFVFMLLPMIASADAVEINGIYYNLDSQTKTAEVTKYKSNKYTGDIVIPSTVVYNETTYDVTSIGKDAFWFCEDITSVYIPNSIISIDERAFYSCSGLTSIAIPNGVTSIGRDAFCDCKMEKITLPATLKTIGEYAFRDFLGKPQVVFCLSLTPPSLSETCLTFNSNSTIYVYQQATDAYKSANSWNNYLYIVGLGNEDMDDFIVNGIHYGDGINNYLRCGIYNISKIGSSNYVMKDFAMFLSNTHTDDITIVKIEAKDSSTDEVLDRTSTLGELKGGETKDFSIFIEKDIDPVYEIYYTYKDRLCLFNTSASDKRQYDLTIQSTGNGKVVCEGETAQSGSVSMKLDGGDTYTITITPDNGYSIESVTVNNTDVTSQVSDGQYTFTMTGNTDISVKFKANKYKLVYMVDGSEYKSYDIEYGASITPEAAPTKEGYTFSGWSDIPTTMPANEVTVSGSFTINKYKLTYMVDGAEYKSYDIEYGASITPEAAPTKEGYTFSGWNNLPQTMPANDVTITGTFTVNKYTLTYTVDGVAYKTYDIEYGITITSEAVPTKEGYTFSGWNNLPQTMPANDVTVSGSFTINKYKLTYMVDGSEYKSYDIEYGATITPETYPTKEGYSFSGWSDIPTTMPARDVTVTGSFSRGAYTLTYIVDGVTYKTVNYDYGATITPETAPTKEGYTFSGWNNLPQTMPANDVTVSGTFTINKYKLTYMVDGSEYKSYDIEYGATITPEATPTKEGYTFSGWSDIPSTMPAQDVTVSGTFTVNKYKLIYKVDGEVYKTYEIEYGASITPEAEPAKEGYTFSGWSYIPSTMPAQDVTVIGTFTQEAEVKNKISYEIVGDNASVSHVDNAKGEIKIEESVEINGKTCQVTAIADGAFQGCTGLTSVELPNTIGTIGVNAFDGCSGLIIIKIGKGIKEIGSKAFANIGNSNVRTRAEDMMLKVYCEAEVLPSTAADAFENTPIDKATLYVADNLVDVYKLVMPWNGFGTIVGLNGTGIRSVSIDTQDARIYDMQGNRLDNVRKGVNIIQTKDGKVRKVVVK